MAAVLLWAHVAEAPPLRRSCGLVVHTVLAACAVLRRLTGAVVVLAGMLPAVLVMDGPVEARGLA
jgi:hypothetical protein